MDTPIDKIKGRLHCIIIHFSDYFFSTLPLCYNKIIIYMENLLDSDWLRTVQFKCDISAKSVTEVAKNFGERYPPNSVYGIILIWPSSAIGREKWIPSFESSRR